MKQANLSRVLMLVGLTLVFSGLTGCAKTIKIYPITGEDFKMVVEGDKQWVCMSPKYVEEVLRVKVSQ